MINSSLNSGFLVNDKAYMSSDFINIKKLSDDGNYCVIFRAERLGKWFLLKGLQPKYQQDAHCLSMLHKEFEIAYQLSHPNIAQTIGMEEIRGIGPCIIQEYVKGKNLREVISSEHWNAELLIKVMKQVGDAVDYLHDCQLVHRDLKPENIMVTTNGRNAKLIDFGLADADDYAILKSPAGTVSYIAPEQANGLDTLDGRADIYSFGIILKELSEAFKCHNRFRNIIKRCTQYDREKRYGRLNEISWKNNNNIVFLLAGTAMVLLVLAGMVLLIKQLSTATPEKTNLPTVTKQVDPSLAQEGKSEKALTGQIIDRTQGIVSLMDKSKTTNNEGATADKFATGNKVAIKTNASNLPAPARKQLTNEQEAAYMNECQKAAYRIMVQNLSWNRENYKLQKTDSARTHFGTTVVKREKMLMRQFNKKALLQILDADAVNFNLLLDMADNYSEKGRLDFLQDTRNFQLWQDALNGK